METRSLNQKWKNFPDTAEKKALIGNTGIIVNYLPGTCAGSLSGKI